MPFALAIVGILLLVSALRGTTGALFTTLKADFTGSGNYIYWVVAILIVGSIGYVKKLQPLSDAFLALLLVVLTLSNKGFFAQFVAGLNSTDTTSCTSNTDNPAISMINSGTILGNQAVAAPPSVLAVPGQSGNTALDNAYQNLTHALGSGMGGF